MIFTLLACMIFLTLYEFFFKYKYLLHPTMIVVLVFDFSIFVAALNYSSWGDINFSTAIVLLSAVVSFILGGDIVSKFRIRKSTVGSQTIKRNKPFICVEPLYTIILIAIMLFVLYMYYLDIKALGMNAGIGNILKLARNAIYGGATIEHSFIVQQGIYLSRAAAYVYIFITTYNSVICKKKNTILNYIPILIYFLQCVLSTGRTELIYFFYAILIINYFLIKGKTNWKRKQDLRFAKKIIVAVCSFCVVFLFIGNVRSGESKSVIGVLSTYFGSSIGAFNDYILENGLGAIADFGGQETQGLYYSLMNRFWNTEREIVYTLAPVTFGGAKVFTNIYTAIRRYLHDYGYAGMLLIQFILGALYSGMFKAIKRQESGLKIIVYAFLSYPLVEMAIEERFFTTVITARTLFILIYILLLYKMLIKKDAYKRL